MSFTVTDLILCLIIFQLLFVSFFLFTHPKGKRVSNRLLGSFFLSIWLNIVDNFLLMKGVYFRFPSWGLWGMNLSLLFGPQLYLYVRSVVYRDFRLKPVHLLHTVPFLLLTFLSLSGYHQLSEPEKRRLLSGIIDRNLPTGFYVVSLGIFLHFSAYLLPAFRQVRKYRRTLITSYSNLGGKNLSWLSWTMGYLLLFFLLSVLNGFLSGTSLAGYYFGVLLVLLLSLFVFVNQFLLKALRQPDFFQGLEDAGPPLPEKIPHPDQKPLRERVLRFMVEQKPYLDPELTLEELARQLSLRPKELSLLINDDLRQHFFDFVNRYRIDEAKRLLAHPKDPGVTVLEVMYQVGFNSKSSFNTLFKKYTGQTPSEYRKQQA
ncbi:helix-turn-helix domain-containing protein [Larkinella soli]|uniref:helix-turn-helix domain-containing protein n=1 Tax=Larkinella soli TaxID=1770527 RepID=UPI000FFC8AFA|nr:AraC family transcriptional regulator [Larkinella soli]